jgi:hypothetical protein
MKPDHGGEDGPVKHGAAPDDVLVVRAGPRAALAEPVKGQLGPWPPWVEKKLQDYKIIASV